MRIAVLVLAVSVLGCNVEMPLDGKDRTPIDFDVQGHRIGEPQPQTARRLFDETFEEAFVINKGDALREIEVRLVYVGGKLTQIEMDFDSVTYQYLLDAYKEKYGEPHTKDKDGVAWQTTDGVLEIDRTRGHASLWSEEYQQHLSEENAKRDKQFRDSL